MKKIGYVISIGILFVSCSRQKVYDTIIRNGMIYDGTGGEPFKTDIGISADTIAVIGDLSEAAGKIEVDATGKFVTPGFIDTHSHHTGELFAHRDCIATLSQGITTIISGQDGFSRFPLSDFFQQVKDTPVAINIASFSGHNTLRDSVLGKNFNRAASPEEINTMKKMFRQDMEAGALGLSTGLEYDPGIYSTKEEVLSLATEARFFNGRYISHIRSEDRYFWDAITEIMNIGKEAGIPVQVSHIKLAMHTLWGKSDSLIQLLNNARKEGIAISCDIYPYDFWQSTIRVLFPNRNFSDEKEAAMILREITLPEDIIMSSYELQPAYEGKTLAAIAQLENKTPARMLVELIARIEDWEKKNNRSCNESIMAKSMNDADIQALLKWPLTSICSDGSNSGTHPRGYGSFTRVLHRYIKETHTLQWAAAIHKMTGLAAAQMGIDNRGLIKQGFFADIVVLNPETVKDHATIAEPQKTSEGIEEVWVNGTSVYKHNKAAGVYPGKLIKRQ